MVHARKMMALVKQTAEMHIDNLVGVIILYVVFYMPQNVLLYAGYLRNIPLALLPIFQSK